MASDRIQTFDEARSDRPAVAARRPERRERAQVLPGDPPWLHDVPTVRLLVRSRAVDFLAIGVVARGVGRSPESVRRWISEGVIPETPLRTPGRVRCAQHRLSTREAVLATAPAVADLGLTERRPRRWDGSELPERLRCTPATGRGERIIRSG